MTITSPPASAPGSKTKAKANPGPKTKTKTNSGSGHRGRGGRPAGGKTSRQRVEDAVADRIIELPDQGQLPPWEKDWRDSANSIPVNAVSMKPHRGVNRWMTLLTHVVMGYQDPRWLTHRQAEALGGHVRRGETSTGIVFWKRVPFRDREDDGGNGIWRDNQPEGSPMGEDGKLRTHPMFRSHRVFSVERTGDCRTEPPPSPSPPSNNSTPRLSATTPAPNCSSNRSNRPPPGAPFSSDSRIVLTSPAIGPNGPFDTNQGAKTAPEST